MPETTVPGAAAAGGDAEPVSRRVLVRLGLGVIGACYAGALGYPVYRYLATPAQRARAAGQVTSVALPVADLPGAGSATMFKFGARPAMLIHHADGSLVCFDAVCTHLGCTVSFEPAKQRIYCACHGGVYDWHTGDALAGPPPRGLTRYQVEVADGQVVIARA